MKCIVCGHEGPDVQLQANPKGDGREYPVLDRVPLCQDFEACWRRCEEREGVVVQRAA